MNHARPVELPATAVLTAWKSGPGTSSSARDDCEASAAARLSHPAVVQIYDLVEYKTGDTLVFEYVEGRTLQELIEEGLPSLALAVRLAGEITEGLAAAHPLWCQVLLRPLDRLPTRDLIPVQVDGQRNESAAC
jgi:hypothetical protein